MEVPIGPFELIFQSYLISSRSAPSLEQPDDLVRYMCLIFSDQFKNFFSIFVILLANLSWFSTLSLSYRELLHFWANWLECLKLIVSYSRFILRTSVHFEKYYWPDLFENCYLPQASLLFHRSWTFTQWAIWLAIWIWLYHLLESHWELLLILSNNIGYIYMRSCTSFKRSFWIIFWTNSQFLYLSKLIETSPISENLPK